MTEIGYDAGDRGEPEYPEQHECEWELKICHDQKIAWFDCKIEDCTNQLSDIQAVSRLNEYEPLKKTYEKLLLLIGVFLDKVLTYASHKRGCTWDDGTKGDVCTCGFRPLISELYAAQDAYADIMEGKDENERR